MTNEEPVSPEVRIANLMFDYESIAVNIWLTNDADDNRLRVEETMQHAADLMSIHGDKIKERSRGGGWQGRGGGGQKSVTEDWTPIGNGCACSKCGQPGFLDPRPTAKGELGKRKHSCKNRECMEQPAGFKNKMYFGIHWPDHCPVDTVPQRDVDADAFGSTAAANTGSPAGVIPEQFPHVGAFLTYALATWNLTAPQVLDRLTAESIDDLKARDLHKAALELEATV